MGILVENKHMNGLDINLECVIYSKTLKTHNFLILGFLMKKPYYSTAFNYGIFAYP